MKGVEGDFSKMSKIQDYKDLVDKAGLSQLDIGILCLNAGIGRPGCID